MKAEPLSGKQVKELMLYILMINIVVLVLDYFAVSDQVFHGKGLKGFFYKAGEIFRSLYFLIFSLLSYSHAKTNLNPKRKIQFENGVKVFLFFIAFSFVLGMIFISSFPAGLNVFLYPFFFLGGTLSIGALILSYNSTDSNISTKATELGVELKPSEKPFAITLDAHGGYVNIPNPFRSVLVIGGAGAGKSASLAEPIISKTIQKHFTGFVYDFKYPTLANVVYSSFNRHQIKDIKFYPISFTELDKSYRFNPLDPHFLESQTYVEEYSWALYSNLDKEAIKKGGFFPESASGLLKAVIWYMKKVHPNFCTLPHVINVILNANTKTLVKMISSDDETKGMMKAVKEAAEKEAYDQLAGVIGSLTMQLQKINTLEINWVLSGNDFTIDLNNPNNPKFIVLGSHPTIRTALSPIIAFIATVALKVMNQQDKQQSMALIDEGPTIFIPNLDEIPATARSNKLAVVYMAQDFSQMDAMYGKEKRTALVANLASQFYGNVSEYTTAKYVSDIVGKEYRFVESVNQGTSSSDSGDSSSSGRSYSEQQRDIIKPQEMFSLPPGTFVGKLVESQNDWFKARLKRIEDSDPEFKNMEIPSFVEDFQLTPEDIKTIDEHMEKIANNLHSIDEYYTKEIENLKERFEENKITIDKVVSESKKELFKDRLKKKRQEVLTLNFQRIQQEVEEILNLYK